MTNSTLNSRYASQVSAGRKELLEIREVLADEIAKSGDKKIFGVGNSVESGNCIEESIRMMQAVDAKEDDVLSVSEFLRRVERSTAALLILARYSEEARNAIEHSLENGETEFKGSECPVCGELFVMDSEHWDSYVWESYGYQACCSDTCEHRRSEQDMKEQKSDIEEQLQEAIELQFDCEFVDWNDDGSVWQLLSDTNAYDYHEYSEGWHKFDCEDVVSKVNEEELGEYCSVDSCEEIEAREESDASVYDAIVSNNGSAEFSLQMAERKVPCNGARITDSNGHELFVHRAESGLGWKVTHGPSGLGFGKVFYMTTYLSEENEKSEYHRSVAIASAYQVAQRFCSEMLEMFSSDDLVDWDDWGRDCGKTIKQVRDNAIEIAETTARMR